MVNDMWVRVTWSHVRGFGAGLVSVRAFPCLVCQVDGTYCSLQEELQGMLYIVIMEVNPDFVVISEAGQPFRRAGPSGAAGRG